MFVFGMGLGSVMQVTVIATQNAVDYKDLGAATSGVTYFRSMGGSFGTAIFGSIFSTRLSANIAHYLGGRLPAGVSSERLSPDALGKLSPAAHQAVIQAYADSIQTVFLTAAPVAAFAFLISWLLPELKLRKTLAAGDPGQTFGMPTDRSSAQELERGLAVLASREDRVALYRRIAAQAGLTGLRPAATCLLARLDDHRGVTRAELAEQIGTSTANLTPGVDQLAGHDLVTIEPGSQAINLTPAGRSALGRLRRAREVGLRALLDDWAPEQEAELDERLKLLARDCIDQDATSLRHDEGFRAAA
jgi:DNA-binding MarR family transcriptional regulator